MTDTLPLSQIYNLARLGHAGDTVAIATDEAQRAAIALWAEVLSLENFSAEVEICKSELNRFALAFVMHVDVTQACVVTLDPVPAHLKHSFSRELHFTGQARRKYARDQIDATPGFKREDAHRLVRITLAGNHARAGHHHANGPHQCEKSSQFHPIFSQ